MKKKICLASILVLFLSCFSIAQEKINPLFFDELNISANRTIVENDNTSDRFGFGIGLYRSWMDSSWINIVSGISYNKTTQHKKFIYHGHFANINNATYNLHYISLPLLVRFNVGEEILFFSELGLYLDLYSSSDLKGTMQKYSPIEGTTYKEVEISGNANNLSSVNYGSSLGLGLRIPLKKHEVIIKFDFKYGLKDLSMGQGNIFNRYSRISIGLRKN